MRQCLTTISFAIAILLLASPSEARTHHHHHHGFHHHHSHHGVERETRRRHYKKHRHKEETRRSKQTGDAKHDPRYQSGSETARTVAHPRGCLSNSFCGCGVAVHVFGHPVRSLWLAANWLSFPRATPAPGMVAVRRGHVFAIIENKGNGRVLAYDPNSGHHKTRIHLRSLAGFKVVNPHANSSYARAG